MYPILEHDFQSDAKIEPSRTIKPRDVPEHCVISFFREVNEKVVLEKQAKVAVPNRWEDGEHPVYEIEHRGRRLAFFHPGVVRRLPPACSKKPLPSAVGNSLWLAAPAYWTRG